MDREPSGQRQRAVNGEHQRRVLQCCGRTHPYASSCMPTMIQNNGEIYKSSYFRQSSFPNLRHFMTNKLVVIKKFFHTNILTNKSKDLQDCGALNNINFNSNHRMLRAKLKYIHSRKIDPLK